MVELKLCPFCASKVEMRESHIRGEGPYIYHLGPPCGMEGFSSFSIEGDLAEAWNRRALSATEAEVERLKVARERADEKISGAIKIGLLEENWDGYGAPQLSKQRIAEIVGIIAMMLPAGFPWPDFVPAADGSIQAEWHLAGIEFEICLGDDGYSAYRSARGGAEEHECSGYDESMAALKKFIVERAALQPQTEKEKEL